MAHFLPVQTMGISERSSKTGNRLLWPSSSEALPQPVWWFTIFRQAQIRDFFFFFFSNGCNFTKRDSSSSLTVSVNIRTTNPVGASQNTYFIRQRKYCSEEEKTPKINFLSYIISSHTRRRKVTKYIKEKTNIAKTARGSPPQRGFGWMLQHGPNKKKKARHGWLKRSMIWGSSWFSTLRKKHWDERGRWHCSGGVICRFTRVRQISKHEASKWIAWAKRGGRYTKKSGPLDGEDDGGLGTERSLSRVIRNLLKEAEREGSWGRLFGSFFFFFWPELLKGGERSDLLHVSFPPPMWSQKQGRKNASLRLWTHTHAHNPVRPDTIRLVHKHADLYKGRTLQSHADGMFRYFCSLTQMCFAAWSLFLLERELL